MTTTLVLTRLAARRDRLMIPIWIYALAASIVGTAVSYDRLYPTQADRLEFAAGLQANPAVLALYGQLQDATTTGGLTSWRLLAIGSALVGVLSILLVVRHTRADEEAGRLELVRSLPVVRSSPLVVALLLAAATDLIVSAVAVVGLLVLGSPLLGSVAFGAGWLSVGLLFAAIAGCAAQLVETSRAANGISMAVLGIAYLLRAVGDSSTWTWLSWLSPIGWAQQLGPFGAQRWWVLVLPAAGCGVFVLAALSLVDRRDLGSGLLAGRPGPPAAGRMLRGSLGLSWRQQRGVLTGWALGGALYGVVLGGVAHGVEGLVSDNDRTRRLIADLGGPGGLSDAFIGLAAGIVAILAAAYGAQAVARLRQEEILGRAELFLSAAPGRTRWAGAHVLGAVAGVGAITLAFGICAGLTDGWRAHDLTGRVPADVAAAAVHIPAECVVAGIAVLIFGLFPRFVVAAWIVLALFVVLGQLGPLFGLPQWLLDVSPFTHTPKLPGATASAAPLVILSVAAIALVVGGLWSFTRRDVG